MGIPGFDTVFLDLDGTLIDSEPGIINSVVYALKKFGIEKERKELLPFIGPPLLTSFQKYTGLSETEARKAVELRTGTPVITSKNAAELNAVVTNVIEEITEVDEEIEDK